MADEWIDPRAESAHRKRAVFALLGIGLLAAIVVLVGLKVLKPTTPTGTAALTAPLDSLAALPTSSVTPGHRSPSSTGSSSGPTGSSGTAPHSRPPKPPGVASCPTDSACKLTSDGGALVAAINHYRTTHGATAVPGSVSSAAAQCALGNGDTSSCPQSYYWEPVSRWNGSDVVAKIVGNGGGASYLLDPAVKSFAVGWAYVPSSKQFLCAVVTSY